MLESRRTVLAMLLGVLVCSQFVSGADAADGWQAGFGKTVITPVEPMFQSGYGDRNKPAEGKVTDLYARAIALRSPAGKTVVMVSLDLIGISSKMAKVITDAAKKQHGLARADVMLCCSHTHCGPALDDELSYMMAVPDNEWVKIRKNQQVLNRNIIQTIGAAVADLKPARLATGIGEAEFASNRRAPIGIGPIDHEVPVLRVLSGDGTKLRGMVFGYACHCTVMSFFQWYGDYAGEAALYLEDRHPGTTALFFAGCGADQNPLPRRRVELGQKYGRMLGVAVDEVLSSEMTSVRGEVVAAFQTIELPFEHVFTKDELQAELKNSNVYRQRRAGRMLQRIAENGPLPKTYPYPIQVWRIGRGLTWVALGGEVVVDYSLRLKRELGLGKTWVAGYSNDVMAYIPSERVLEEGGYEGDTSMIVYQQPSKWAPGLENKIVTTVRRLSRQSP